MKQRTKVLYITLAVAQFSGTVHTHDTKLLDPCIGRDRTVPAKIAPLFDSVCTLYATGNTQKALDQCRVIQQLAPDIAEVYYNCAILYIDLNNHHRARHELKQALEKNPQYTKAEIALGLSYARDNKLDKALQYLEHTIERDPLCIQAHVACARILCKKGSIDQAEQHLRKALSNGIPSSLESAFEIANLMLIVGHPEENVTILTHLDSQYPHNPSIMHNLAFGLRATGKFEESATLLKKVVTLFPHKKESQLALGHTLLQMGIFDQGWIQHDWFLSHTHRYSPSLKTSIREKKLQGKHIMLTQEGGVGDTIQWIRCAKNLKELGLSLIHI